MAEDEHHHMAEDEHQQQEWRRVLASPIRVERFQPVSSEIELEVAAASDCGKVRIHNTDHYLSVRVGRLQETLLTSLSAEDLPPRFEEYAYAMVVADGLGDKGAGARASRAAISALAHLAIRYGRWNVRIGPDTPSEIVEQAEFFVRQANEAVIAASRADLRLADMATSLTAVYIVGTDLFFTHAGHSRAFLFRDGVLNQLTTDHTLEHGLETSRLRVLDRSRMDLKHVITESVGGRPGGPDAEIEHVVLFPGDRILLCTNGLTDVVNEDQIADVLALQRHPEDDCRHLVGLALAAGAPDNVTVLTAAYRVRSEQ